MFVTNSFSQVTDVSFLLLYNFSLTFVIFSTDDDGQFGEGEYFDVLFFAKSVF